MTTHEDEADTWMEQLSELREAYAAQETDLNDSIRATKAAREQARQAQAELAEVKRDRDKMQRTLSHPAVRAVVDLVEDRDHQYRRAEAAHDAKDEANQRWLDAVTK